MDGDRAALIARASEFMGRLQDLVAEFADVTGPDKPVDGSELDMDREYDNSELTTDERFVLTDAVVVAAWQRMDDPGHQYYSVTTGPQNMRHATMGLLQEGIDQL